VGRVATSPQRDVLGHTQCVHEHEVLVDHPYAASDRVGRGGDGDLRAVNLDFALVGRYKP